LLVLLALSKAVRGGEGALNTISIETASDEELLAAVIGLGSRGLDSLSVARSALEAAGGVEGLREHSTASLCAVGQIGPARARAILAALELGRRSLGRARPGERLGSSADVHDAFWTWLAGERVEVFGCALVDAKLRLIDAEQISRGTLTASIVHPREAFAPAVRNSASGVIFIHNHPSGDPDPSDEDRRITCRLSEVGHILGIPVLDHVVLGTPDSYFSFADAGLIEGGAPHGYRGMVLR